MSLAAIIILIILGIVLLILEVLVVPGGILGVIALGMIGFGVYGIYVDYGTTYGHIALGMSLLATIAAIYYSLKSGTWDRIALKEEINSRANEIDGTVIIEGKTGIAISDIRPMGTALFDDEKFEVSSEGEKILVHSKISILRVDGSKIFVTKSE